MVIAILVNCCKRPFQKWMRKFVNSRGFAMASLKMSLREIFYLYFGFFMLVRTHPPSQGIKLLFLVKINAMSYTIFRFIWHQMIPIWHPMNWKILNNHILFILTRKWSFFLCVQLWLWAGLSYSDRSMNRAFRLVVRSSFVFTSSNCD